MGKVIIKFNDNHLESFVNQKKELLKLLVIIAFLCLLTLNVCAVGDLK